MPQRSGQVSHVPSQASGSRALPGEKLRGGWFWACWCWMMIGPTGGLRMDRLHEFTMISPQITAIEYI
jgi:hypothetical protein